MEPPQVRGPARHRRRAQGAQSRDHTNKKRNQKHLRMFHGPEPLRIPLLCQRGLFDGPGSARTKFPAFESSPKATSGVERLTRYIHPAVTKLSYNPAFPYSLRRPKLTNFSHRQEFHGYRIRSNHWRNFRRSRGATISASRKAFRTREIVQEAQQTRHANFYRRVGWRHRLHRFQHHARLERLAALGYLALCFAGLGAAGRARIRICKWIPRYRQRSRHGDLHSFPGPADCRSVVRLLEFRRRRYLHRRRGLRNRLAVAYKWDRERDSQWSSPS